MFIVNDGRDMWNSVSHQAERIFTGTGLSEGLTNLTKDVTVYYPTYQSDSMGRVSFRNTVIRKVNNAWQRKTTILGSKPKHKTNQSWKRQTRYSGRRNP